MIDTLVLILAVTALAMALVVFRNQRRRSRDVIGFFVCYDCTASASFARRPLPQFEQDVKVVLERHLDHHSASAWVPADGGPLQDVTG